MKMIATSSLILLVCGLLHATSGEAGVTIGSTTQVQIIAATALSGGSNLIARYAEMASGFSLANSSAGCTFDSAFPVNGPIALNAGQLSLTRNLVLEGGATVTSLGKIYANGYSFYLAETMSSFGAASDGVITFDTMNLVLRSNITLNATLIFTGTSSIISRNQNTLTLGPTGAIIVGSGGNLTLSNIAVQGVGPNNIHCTNASSKLILDNVFWTQSYNTTFSAGSLLFRNTVEMSGQNLVFAYQSSQVSTVTSNSELILSPGFTFSYDPVISATTNLIQFIDQTAQLVLNSATLHATTTGMSLQKGTLVVEGNSAVSSEYDQSGNLKAIALGSDNSATDMVCLITPGAQLSIVTGALDYRNVSANSLLMQNLLSSFLIFSGASLRVYESMNLGVGQAIFQSGATLSTASGKAITGPLVPQGTFIRNVAT